MTKRAGPQGGLSEAKRSEAKRSQRGLSCKQKTGARRSAPLLTLRSLRLAPAPSDLDFLVEFDAGAPAALSLKTYIELKEALEALFGRHVDLVERARCAIHM